MRLLEKTKGKFETGRVFLLQTQQKNPEEECEDFMSVEASWMTRTNQDVYQLFHNVSCHESMTDSTNR